MGRENILPKDWKWVKLEDLANKISLNKIKIKQKDYLLKGDFPVVDQGQDLIGGYYNDENLIVPFEPPYIIFGDHTKIKKFINFKFIPGADGVKVLKPKETVNPKFLYYSLFTIKIEDKGYARHFQLIEKELFPLPPLSTQHLIVAKIEELFSELDKGIENLKLAQLQLKTYRQSVLKWAFEGKLSEVYNSRDAKNNTENIKDSFKNLELPKGWKASSIGDIFEVFIGSTPKRNNLNYWGGEIKWISSGEVSFCNIYDTKEKISSEGLQNTSCKVHPPGTVIMAMIGEGKTRGQVGILKVEATHNQNTAAIRVNESTYLSKLLYHFLVFKYEENRKVGSGNNQKALNKERVKSISIPLPPIQEQHLIIQEIESRLSVADKMEESITQSLQQAEALRQSILKKAFEGKLIVEKKPEITKPANVYIHQVQVLGWIAQTSKQNGISHGEMTTAKYAYLVDKVYGVPTHYDFKRGHLGPYPIEMKKAINNKEYFKIAKTIELVNEETLFKYNNPYKDQVIAAVNELAIIFGRYEGKERAHKTELLATVCKVIEDIKSTDLALVYQSMREWPIDLKTTAFKNKAEKFTEEETQKCLAFIVERGWDKKLITYEA